MKRFCFVAPLLCWVAGAGMSVAMAQSPPDSGSDSESCSNNMWLNAEYLNWWGKKQNLSVPLVTTGDPNVLTGGGVLGRPSTQVLFGDQDIPPSNFSGARLSGGFWIEENRDLGFDGSFFILPQVQGNPFQANSNPPATNTVLTIPYASAVSGNQTGTLVSFPGAIGGSIIVSNYTEMLGADASLAFSLVRTSNLEVALLAGARYLNLREDFNLSTNSTILFPSGAGPGGFATFFGKNVAAGQTIQTADDFMTDNHFYGGQVGIRGEWNYERFHLTGVGKLGLGGMEEIMNIIGESNSSVSKPATAPDVPLGGILANINNTGSFARTQFVVIPEVGLTAGFDVTTHLRAMVGYNFMYISDVQRPGNAIDQVVNLATIPTGPLFQANSLTNPARPTFAFQSSTYWVQGINAGVSIRF